MVNTRRSLKLRALLAAIAVVVWTAPATAATCSVPSGTHPDIQTAVDDIGCDPIVVGAGSYLQTVVVDRSLSLQGTGSGQSFILGGVEVQAGTVNIAGFHISGPGEALWSHSGAEVSGFDLQIVSGGAVDPPLFVDGFETGTTSAWAAVSP